jgi:hypothetical protein
MAMKKTLSKFRIWITKEKILVMLSILLIGIILLILLIYNAPAKIDEVQSKELCSYLERITAKAL